MGHLLLKITGKLKMDFSKFELKFLIQRYYMTTQAISMS